MVSDELIYVKDKSASLKRKFDELSVKYKRLEDENGLKTKELGKWKGEMNALKKMELGELHEFELKVIETLQKVREAANMRFENENECRVCMVNRKNTVLIPCGHCLCSNCVKRVTKCPMCRATIRRSVELK